MGATFSAVTGKLVILFAKIEPFFNYKNILRVFCVKNEFYAPRKFEVANINTRSIR